MNLESVSSFYDSFQDNVIKNAGVGSSFYRTPTNRNQERSVHSNLHVSTLKPRRVQLHHFFIFFKVA